MAEVEAAAERDSSPGVIRWTSWKPLNAGDYRRDGGNGRPEARPTNPTHRCHSQIACLLLAVLFTGCSTFDRDWHAAGQTASGTNDPLGGRWEGTWRSEVNGHTDRLRCLATPLTNGFHTARFHAKYKKGIFRFSFRYSVPLQVRRTNDAVQFEGAADLGWLAGGVYHYEGSAAGTNFFSTYRCKYDHGTFQMTRPNPQ